MGRTARQGVAAISPDPTRREVYLAFRREAGLTGPVATFDSRETAEAYAGKIARNHGLQVLVVAASAFGPAVEPDRSDSFPGAPNPETNGKRFREMK